MLNTQGLPVWKKILQWLNHTHHQMLIGEESHDMMNNHIFQNTLGLGFIFILNSDSRERSCIAVAFPGKGDVGPHD